MLQTKQNIIIFSYLGNTDGMETTITIILPRVLNVCFSSNVPLLAEMSVGRTFVWVTLHLTERQL
jgi:hypothetical protein